MLTRIRTGITSVVVLGLAFYGFLAPGVLITRGLRDPGLGSPVVPGFVWRWHRSLTPRFAAWARQRVADRAGATVPYLDVAATEWPMFGSIFFLEATEALEDVHRALNSPRGESPRKYAAAAIDASARLIVDPSNAAWVERHWGADYLHRENVFYRMLLIRGLTIQMRLRGKSNYETILRQQNDSLAAELLAAPSGFLDDYPGEAFPTDVLWAVVAIRKADVILGTDHHELAARFLAKCLAPRALGNLGLPPYMIDAPTGVALDDSRGCTNTGLLTQAPHLSPEQSSRWYDLYARHFWQRRAGMAGFTEFPRRDGVDFFADVDAGPVIWGYGLAASAFGLGAARANGRFDHARPLAGLALVFSWPLPNGSLLVPRFFSNVTDAPLIGEAGLLFAFSRLPRPGVVLRAGGAFPPLVFIVLVLYFALGIGLAVAAAKVLCVSCRSPSITGGSRIFATWLSAIAVGATAFAFGFVRVGVAAIAFAVAVGMRR